MIAVYVIIGIVVIGDIVIQDDRGKTITLGDRLVWYIRDYWIIIGHCGEIPD